MTEPNMKHPKYGSFWDYEIPYAFIKRWNEGDTDDIVDSFEKVLARATVLDDAFVLCGARFTNVCDVRQVITLRAKLKLFKGPDMLLLSREPEFAQHFHPDRAYLCETATRRWYAINDLQLDGLGYVPYNIATITFPPNVNKPWVMEPWVRDMSREKWVDLEDVDARLPYESVASEDLRRDVEERSQILQWYSKTYGVRPDVFEFDTNERFVYLRCRGPCAEHRRRFKNIVRGQAETRIDSYGHVQVKDFTGERHQMVHRLCCPMENWISSEEIVGEGPMTCLRCERIKYRDLGNTRYVYVGPKDANVVCDCDM